MPKNIKIDHIAKSEGHMGFVAHILKGDIKSARLEVHEGSRLIEGLLIGRQYDEAPIITSRICGICPIVHNICSLKAIESALDIKISKQTKLLRKLLLYAQIIQSHTLHLFMLSESKKILPIRDWINKFVEIIAGRAIHPLTTMIAGFRKLPDIKALKKLMREHNKILKLALKLIPEHKDQPDFYRKTEFRALKTIYGDGIEIIPVEIQKGVVQRTENTYMLGAIARLHLYKDYEHDLKMPCYNTFYNLYAQALEIAYYLEKIKKLLPKRFKKSNIKYKIKAGIGRSACEAPRGTLYHNYEIDKTGKIINANIITPTAQFLNNLEADLKEYLKDDWDPEKAKNLIRAYDPCISCAVH
ncbi:MAG: nickel-dependent hydrogenase large subunit [bacterium]